MIKISSITTKFMAHDGLMFLYQQPRVPDGGLEIDGVRIYSRGTLEDGIDERTLFLNGDRGQRFATYNKETLPELLSTVIRMAAKDFPKDDRFNGQFPEKN